MTHGQGYKVVHLGAIRVCMPIMKSVSLMVQQLWPRLKLFLPQTDRPTHIHTFRQDKN